MQCLSLCQSPCVSLGLHIHLDRLSPTEACSKEETRGAEIHRTLPIMPFILARGCICLRKFTCLIWTQIQRTSSRPASPHMASPCLLEFSTFPVWLSSFFLSPSLRAPLGLAWAPDNNKAPDFVEAHYTEDCWLPGLSKEYYTQQTWGKMFLFLLGSQRPSMSYI